MNPFVSGIVVAVIVTAVALAVIRKSLYKSLLQLLQTGKYNEFNKKADSSLCRFFFSKSALLEMKFHAAIVCQKTRDVERILDQLQKLSLSRAASQKLSMKAFNYFVGLMDKKKAKKYLDLVLAGPDARMKQEASRVYNIYILKSDADLNDLLEELEEMPEQARGVHEFLISRIYKNAGKQEESDKFARLSRMHFAIVDEKTAARLKKSAA